MNYTNESPAKAINEQNEGIIIPYAVQSQDIQIEIIKNEPWFAAIDVCNILELQNPSDVLKKTLDEDEYLTYTVDRAGQRREMNFVNESGLYNLIFQSRKPGAKKFRKWVTSEVLPQLRKTGSYTLNPGGPMPIVAGSANPFHTAIKYCDKVVQDEKTWYAAIQLVKLMGKGGRSGRFAPLFEKLQAAGKAIKVPNDTNGRWYVSGDSIGLLLGIRPLTADKIYLLTLIEKEVAHDTGK